jgi:hypothetical protein
MRMVRAIALLALMEAARHGAYHASFHGFRVRALRHVAASGFPVSVDVSLAVTLGQAVVEHCEISVAATHASDVHGDRIDALPGRGGTIGMSDGH